MTLPKLSTLSDEEKRVMIAKEMRWTGWHQIPNYLTDANAALTLCDRMVGDGWCWKLGHIPKRYQKLHGGKVMCVFWNIENPHSQIEHYSSTAPLAISHAFLLANQLAEL